MLKTMLFFTDFNGFFNNSVENYLVFNKKVENVENIGLKFTYNGIYVQILENGADFENDQRCK